MNNPSVFDLMNGDAEQRSHQSDHPKDPVVAGWWGGGGETSAGVSVTPDISMRQSAVFACVRVLAETLASVPLLVYRRLTEGGKPAGKERDRRHRLWRLLHDAPNRWQTSFEFREMLMGHAALRGNAYAEIIATGTDPVAELIPLHPDRVRPFFNPGGVPAYVFSPLSGPSRIILKEEMFHIRGLSTDGLIGLNPIKLHREAVGSSLAAQEYGGRFFLNDATPRGVIYHPEHFESDDDEERFRKSWQSGQSGINRHKTAILEDGLKFEQLGMTHEDAQFIDSRKYNDLEIARIFRVPPHKIGILDRATFSNIEQQSIDFLTDTMLPWFTRWEQAIRRDLFTADSNETHYAAFNVMGLLRGDAKARSDFYKAGRQWGWLSANDIRELEDMNPIVGGDIYLSPANMTPAETLAAQIEDLTNAE